MTAYRDKIYTYSSYINYPLLRDINRNQKYLKIRCLMLCSSRVCWCCVVMERVLKVLVHTTQTHYYTMITNKERNTGSSVVQAHRKRNIVLTPTRRQDSAGAKISE